MARDGTIRAIEKTMARKQEEDGGGAQRWAKVKRGDWISLSDLESFAAGGMGGVDYKVRQVSLFRAKSRDSGRELAEYRIVDLDVADGSDCRFVIVSSGEDFELRFYFAPSAFAKGTRDRLVDLGQTWFFLPPPDPEDFISCDLEYAPWPDLPAFDDGGGEEKRSYGPHGFGLALFCECSRGDEDFPAILMEYAALEKAKNPLLLLIEERWMRSGGEVPAEGGFVTVLAGRGVSEGDVEHIPA